MISPIIQIAQDVADLATTAGSSLQRPVTLEGAYDEGDATPARIRLALQLTAERLAEMFDFPQLKREHEFSTIAEQVQPQATWEPAWFLRFVPGSLVNVSTGLPLRGPVSSEEWAQNKVHNAIDVDTFYTRDNAIIFGVAPDAGQKIQFEYVRSSVGRRQVDGAWVDIGRFEKDQDRAWFDDRIMRAGALLQLQIMEGMATQIDFDRLAHNEIANSGHPRTVSMRTTDSAARQLGALKTYVTVIRSAS